MTVAAKAMAGKERFEVAVKGLPKDGAKSSFEGKLGDCPFTHRVLLTLEEKQIPYVKHYVNTHDKPEWLSEAHPEKKVPAVKDLNSNKWIADSAAIVDYIEDEIPEPPLGKTGDSKNVGEGLFPAFVSYLQSFDKAEEKEKRSYLRTKLQEIDTFLQSHKPYIHGKSVGPNDLELAPKLHHVQLVTKQFKDWDVYTAFPAIGEYAGAMQNRQSWKNTKYEDGLVIQEWGDKVKSFKG